MTEKMLEQLTLDSLKKLGYSIENGTDLSRDYQSALMDDVLERSLMKLNPEVDRRLIEEAILKIKNLDQNHFVLNNKLFSEYLHSGVKVAEQKNGETFFRTVKLIDFENREKNHFLVINQFTMEENSTKRPDIVIFINGLPLVVFELKSPSREEVSLEDAFRQLKGYMNVHIPSLFYYNQICVITDGAIAKAGTITCDYNRFTEWKKTGSRDNVYKTNTHESLIDGMLKKETLLNLIQNYILYSDDNKILPAYHQYYGVEKAIEKTLNTTNGKAGIVWHTQGSGKSFSMVFYTGNMIQKLSNPTIIVITDRNDLDDQLYKTFSKCSQYLKQHPVKIESRADLKKRLDNIKSGGVIFTTIQKFEEELGLLSARKNILVIADEAHRSHYGLEAKMKMDAEKRVAYRKYGTAKYLHTAFPNATYIGFTGTPVETKDRSTVNIFGDIIDIYDMSQAILDGSTVPIHYESRMSKIGLNEKILKQIDEYYEKLEQEYFDQEEQITQSKKAMASMKKIIEDKSRLSLIVKDIINHYEERKNLSANKAMVVAYSRQSAYTMYQLFLELKPEWKNIIHMIITPSNKDDENMQKAIGSKKEKEKLETEFKDPHSDFKIAIVVDMWLTGFDVPSLGTMYVDKPMKTHNLMQAIARVNRVYKNKESGLIVDYIGLKKWLLEALEVYTSRDRENIVDSEFMLKVLVDKLELAQNMLHPINYQNFMKGSNEENYQLINEGANHILQEEKTKKEFLNCSLNIKNLYSVCSGLLTPELKNQILYIISVRSFLIKLNGEKLDIREINANVAKLLEIAIQKDELICLGTIKSNHNFELLNDEMMKKLQTTENKNIVAEVLKQVLKEYIEQIGSTNVVMMEQFSERFKKIVETYNERTAVINIESIPIVSIINEMIKLKQEIEASFNSDNEYDLSQEEKAFFDALGKEPSIRMLMKDEILVLIAKELVETVNKNMTIDWDLKENTRAYMRTEIRKLLIKYHYPPTNQKSAVDAVIKQAEMKCRNMLK